MPIRCAPPHIFMFVVWFVELISPYIHSWIQYSLSGALVHSSILPEEVARSNPHTMWVYNVTVYKLCTTCFRHSVTSRGDIVTCVAWQPACFHVSTYTVDGAIYPVAVASDLCFKGLRGLSITFSTTPVEYINTPEHTYIHISEGTGTCGNLSTLRPHWGEAPCCALFFTMLSVLPPPDASPICFCSSLCLLVSVVCKQ